MSQDTTMLDALQETIRYRFRDSSLLLEAVTHRSFINENPGKLLRDNQRLEFFGDAVIDFLVSRLLLDRFPDSREGALTKMRASLVDEGSLAFLAEGINLGACLRLGRGEERTGGRKKRSLLADVYEALVAAVYMDGGLEPAWSLVESHFSALIDARTTTTDDGDYKTELQELAHATLGLLPRYVLTCVSGPEHQRSFTVSVNLGEDLYGEGSGRTKKEAEQAAARKAVEQLKGNAET